MMKRMPLEPASGSPSDAGSAAAAVHVELRADAVVVHVTGDLDTVDIATFREALPTALRSCPPILVIDLSGVTQLSAPAFYVLMGSDFAGAEHTSIRVVTGDGKIAWPQTVSDLDRYLNVYPTLDAALRT